VHNSVVKTATLSTAALPEELCWNDERRHHTSTHGKPWVQSEDLTPLVTTLKLGVLNYSKNCGVFAGKYITWMGRWVSQH